MPGSDTLTALMAEYRRLDRAHDASRIREILRQAAPLVDRHAEPEKWAAMRSQYAQLSENDDSIEAVAAYRDGLTVWQPDAHHDSWVQCHAGIGYILARMSRPGTEEWEQAITHLESAVTDQPFLASMLAYLYHFRITGDPAENWQRRIQYLELALTQVSSEHEPAKWAFLENDLGLAYGEQPGADFNRALERRLACHQAALAALGRQDAGWAETCLRLSECYQFRVQGEARENLRQAEDYSRQALAALAGAPDADLERQALLSLGRILALGEGADRAPRLREALSCFERAGGLIDACQTPHLLANVETLRADAYLELMRLGEADCLEPLVASCEAALGGLDRQVYRDESRRVLQIQGQALLEAGAFAAAADCFDRAVQAGEVFLAQASTVAGRIERIFQLADSSALLAYCRVQLGQMRMAVEALDRGKMRLWSAPGGPDIWDELPNLIPQPGALLFPVFAHRQGAVIVLTREAEAVQSDVVWLPQFGKQRLMELQRGDPAMKELGGWLYAYSFRNSQPENWRRQIDAIGAVLYDEIWRPVLSTLERRGVPRGAELVWFSQGGSGVFPLHAGWTMEDGQRRWLIEEYAVRYAPSVRALLADLARSDVPGPALIVSDPTGDLVFSPLECEWVTGSLGSQGATVLAGEAAARQPVLAALPGCGVVHFATHAAFNLDNPLESYIMLAGQEPLTLAELLPRLKEHAPSFVVLSACETAMARVTTTADEFLGFPAALLAHGTRTVLATLWPVNDAAAAFVVGRFYREYTNGQNTAAQALRRAQDWLRTVTVRELSELLRGLRGEPAPVGALAASLRTQLRGTADEVCPFADPYYWAAFTVSG